MSPSAAIDVNLLPPRLQDFVRLIGLDATLAFSRRYSGLRIYIPTPERVHPEHPFAKIIGVHNLLRLAQDYGAEPHFQLPKADAAFLAVRNARIAHAYAHHKTVRELATEHHLTERQVERIVASLGVRAPAGRRRVRAPADRRQATLF